MREIKLPANIVITGATMSGKTCLTTKLIKEQLIKQIDYLIFFSPTIEYSQDFGDFQETLEEDRNSLNVKKYTNPDNYKSIIKQIVTNEQSLFKSMEDKKTIPKILFVFDDLVNHNILTYRGVVDVLSTKSRHLNISMIVLVQRISAIPKTFRLNSKYVFFFSAVNFLELEQILEQYCSKKYKKSIQAMIEKIFTKKYQFILAENFQSNQKDRLWLNGEKNIINTLL